MTSSAYIGLDISKRRIDVADPHRFHRSVENTPEGHAALIDMLQSPSLRLIVVEASGGYEAAVVKALQARSLPVAVVQAARARYFARGRGQLAKTDSLDARMLASFGEANQPRLTLPMPPILEELRALRDRRGQLVEDRTREIVRQEACQNPSMLADITDHVEALTQRIHALDQRILALVRSDADLQERMECLESVAGVGPQTAVTLLTHLPELGTLNRQAAAALAGVAPYDDSSGPRDGQRHIAGGRAVVRRALYLAALAAARVRTGSPLYDFYRSLREKGKPAKVALIAVARKLLVHLNTLLKPLVNKVA